MKALSLLLIFGAFLVGAFLSVLDPQLVKWNIMAPVLAVGAIGLFLYRKAEHGESRAEHMLTGNIGTLASSLDNILANLETLHAGKADLPTYEARFEIDRLFRDDLNNFADARESMMHVFGTQNYADVMSNFDDCHVCHGSSCSTTDVSSETDHGGRPPTGQIPSPQV